MVLLLILLIWNPSSYSTYRVESGKLTIAEVQYGDFQEYILLGGTVMPSRTVYLDAVEGGRVEAIYLEEGSFVTVGDSILKLDNTDLHLDIMYREAQRFEQINNFRNTRLAMEQNRLELQSELLDIDRKIGNFRREFEQNCTSSNNPLTTTQLADTHFPLQPLQHDPNLLLSRILPPGMPTNLFHNRFRTVVLFGTHHGLLSATTKLPNSSLTSNHFCPDYAETLQAGELRLSYRCRLVGVVTVGRDRVGNRAAHEQLSFDQGCDRQSGPFSEAELRNRYALNRSASNAPGAGRNSTGSQI